jgi:hemolysin activation/secretion protein
VRVEQGIIPTLANTRVAFASAPGIAGARIAGGKLTFLYDTRDSQLTPIKGSYVNFSTELNSNVERDEANRWLRFTLDARHLFPHDGDSKVFVVRFLADGVMRARLSPQEAIPFYERPTLGGENTLRAFGLNRYFDNQAWAINIEERILVYQKDFVGHKVDLEVAPSLDMGKVQDLSVQGFSLNQAQINPGVGFRVMARPHVVGRLDVAYGRDGGNAFVGVDYPF